jgi:hypothetical protein
MILMETLKEIQQAINEMESNLRRLKEQKQGLKKGQGVALLERALALVVEAETLFDGDWYDLTSAIDEQIEYLQNYEDEEEEE